MKPQTVLLVGCYTVLYSIAAINAAPQGTGKVQEFFKKYFAEYFPKTTRSYTLYGNGLNGPADLNAGLPVAEDMQEGPIQNIIIRRGSPSRKNSSPGQAPSLGAPQTPGLVAGGQQFGVPHGPGLQQFGAPQGPTAHQLPATLHSSGANQFLATHQSPNARQSVSAGAPAPTGPSQDNTWQPTSFDPVAFSKGGHRGRSDLTSEFDDEPEIITAEDAQQIISAADATREFQMESSMSFNPGF